jgi:DNA modification methylase
MAKMASIHADQTTIPSDYLSSFVIHAGNNLDVLPTLPDNSVDSIVTDPPYELNFMGRKWDNSGIAYSVELWKECLRVLKPGGHLLSFGGTRTWHRVAVAIEDAGFDVRDSIAWIYASGFPKSHNLKDEWQGWGTALKPAFEPVIAARKPLIGTVAANVLEHGTGALNIDGSRIGTEGGSERQGKANLPSESGWANMYGHRPVKINAGRWPANVILDEYSAGELDKQSGTSSSKVTAMKAGLVEGIGSRNLSPKATAYESVRGHSDSGGASRFFYVAKASKRDRNEGLEGSNFHPTVKPTNLMRYLVKLVTPPGGTVLDPFTGSGSTGKAAILEGFDFIGIEMTEEYLPIIDARLKHAEQVRDQQEQAKDEGLF